MKIDLKGKILGRYISVMINKIRKLVGKIIIINSSKIKIKSIKTKKNIFKHNGRPGGFLRKRFKEEFNRNPNKIILRCIKGMLKENNIRRKIIKNIQFK
ncbi:uL13 family ribosomal protein [Candidatus Vidania fulgoroideorum]